MPKTRASKRGRPAARTKAVPAKTSGKDVVGSGASLLAEALDLNTLVGPSAVDNMPEAPLMSSAFVQPSPGIPDTGLTPPVLSTSMSPHLDNTASVSLFGPSSFLGNNISEALKGKIRASAFVELALLLPVAKPTGGESLPKFNLAINPEDPGQFLLQQQTSNQRKITSIFDWTTAFNVYISIFIVSHPSRAQELLRYMALIRFACRKFGGFSWRDYDFNFRLTQAAQPSRSWAVIDGMLWLETFTPANVGVNNSFRNPSYGQQPLAAADFSQQRKKVCFAFNGKGGCSRDPCPFQHACQSCGVRGHSKLACRRGKTGQYNAGK